jgi:hypothetical protein
MRRSDARDAAALLLLGGLSLFVELAQVKLNFPRQLRVGREHICATGITVFACQRSMRQEQPAIRGSAYR